MQVLLTIACFGSLLGLITSLLHPRRTPPAVGSSTRISWRQFEILLAPFAIVYSLLLIPRATTTDGIYDRYLLPLLVVALLCLVRYYQDRIQPRIPFASVLLVAMMAIYGVTVTHNTFSFYRARVAIAAELRAAGVPNSSVDNGWEYNLGVELQIAEHINNPGITLPTHAYVPTPAPPAGSCQMFWYDKTPHIHPPLRHLFRSQRLLRPCFLRSRALLPLASLRPRHTLRRPLHLSDKAVSAARTLLT